MRRLGVLLMLSTVVGCTQPEGRAMSAFVDDYFNSFFEWSPTAATSAGFHEYDSRIEDYSATAIHRRIEKLKQLQSGLSSVREGKLTADEEIDAEILEGQLRAELL